MSEAASPETGLSVLMRDDPKRYYLSVLGPLGLGLSLGLQLTLTAFMLLGPSSDAWFADQLTEYGKSLTRPEHELTIYCGGVVFTLVSIWVTEWWWRGKLQRIPTGDLVGFMTFGALLQGRRGVRRQGLRGGRPRGRFDCASGGLPFPLSHRVSSDAIPVTARIAPSPPVAHRFAHHVY